MTQPLINRVPVAPISKVIRDWMAKQPDLSRQDFYGGDNFPAPLTLLAEWVDVSPDAIRSYIRDDRQDTMMSFDTADKILCVLHRSDLWLGELNDIYRKVVLVDEDASTRRAPAKVTKRVCAAYQCANEFIPRAGGGRGQLYCCRKCRVDQANRRQVERRRILAGREKPRYSNPNDCCPQGHDWTEENTYRWKRDGKKLCRTCMRERARERRARLRDAA